MTIQPGRGVPNLDENALNIFTDGSSLGSPRAGGCAFVLVWCDENGEQQVEPVPGSGFAGATNNEMELQACIEALRDIQGRYTGRDLSDFSKVVIYTDSDYVASNLSRAQTDWPRQKWANRHGKPIDNVPSWKALVKEIERIRSRHGKRVEIKWHKGHNKHSPLNKQVDKLAKESAKSAPKRHLYPVNVAPKLSPNPTEEGSVKMMGQTMTIRIIGHNWQPAQKVFKYRYEVMNSDSPYHQKVDFIYSAEILHRHHWYEVVVNDQPKNPRIIEVLNEVQPD